MMPSYVLERWEHGSDFHWLDFQPLGSKPVHPWSGVPSVMFGSGRDALRALLAHGAASLGWKRIFIPSYFCQEVVAAIRTPGMELNVYLDAPGEAPLWPQGIGPGDTVLVVNFFGLRAEVDSSELRRSGAFVVEDHTHDPWSTWAKSSKADFCVVALRKTLPVPEGGIIWSPCNAVLPVEPVVTSERQWAADTKRAGMLLKSLYLRGHAVAKGDFRDLLIEGEKRIATGVISGMTLATHALIACLPTDHWREQRLINFETLAQVLEVTCAYRVLRPERQGCVPFNATVVADTPKQREALRVGLIDRRVYPAVLWSLEMPVVGGIPSAHVDLSRRILSLHCDTRYSEDDLNRVASYAAMVTGGGQ